MSGDSVNETDSLSETELKKQKLEREIAILDAKLDKPDSFWEGVTQQLQSQFLTITLPILVVVLTFLSTLMLDSIKGWAATSRDRQSTFEIISRDLGHYVFLSETEEEFIGNDWTSLTELVPITTEYNKSITQLRENEFKYSALLTKYWDQDRAAQFQGVMEYVKKTDHAVHGLNEEVGELLLAAKAVENTTNQPSKKSADPAVSKKVAGEIQESLDPLRSSIQKLLDSLSEDL